jgi:hypothetical protein
MHRLINEKALMSLYIRALSLFLVALPGIEPESKV